MARDLFMGTMQYAADIYRRLPGTVQSLVQSLSPVSPEALRASRIEYHTLPIRYGKFTTDIPVPADLQSPWRNYDREQRPYHEPLATGTYVQRLSSGDVFWDVGSRYGYEATVAATLVGPSNVHVFEAQPEHKLQLDRLNRDRFDGKIIINNVLVGTESARNGQDVLVLDEYVTEHGRPDFVKIDVEGSEADAVASMRETITTSTPTLLIEVHPTMEDISTSSSQAEMFDLLRSVYDTVRCSTNYRNDGAAWSETVEGQDEQSYQVLCEN